MNDVHVVALCGSLRAESYTRIALEHVLDAAGAAGASTELLDLREFEPPVFDADRDRADAGDAATIAASVRRPTASSSVRRSTTVRTRRR